MAALLMALNGNNFQAELAIKMRHTKIKAIHKCIYYRIEDKIHIHLVKDYNGKEIEKVDCDLDAGAMVRDHSPSFNAINVGYYIQISSKSFLVVKLNSYYEVDVEPFHKTKKLLELFSEKIVEEYNVFCGRLIQGSPDNALIYYISN